MSRSSKAKKEKISYVTENFNRKSTRSNRTLFSGNCSKRYSFCIRADSHQSCDRAIEGEDITAQAELVCKNIGALLEAAGTDYTKVVKTTCFLADMGDFAAFNEVYAKYFTEKPARSCVAVKALPKNVLCEVEVIAAV